MQTVLLWPSPGIYRGRQREAGCVCLGFVAGLPAAIDPVEDGAKLTLQGDAVAAALLAWGDHNAIDDFANRVVASSALPGWESVSVKRSILRL